MQTAALALLVIIRIYDMSSTRHEDAQAASHVASRILHQAGLDSAWVVCPFNHPTANSDACGLTPTPREVVIRLVSSATLSGGGALGDAFVDTATGGGTLATVYRDRVAHLAEEAGIDTGTLLGRTMAHEVGHLLLGTNAHAPTGLMRATWTSDLLRRRIGADWQFSRDERAALARNLIGRTPAP